ncbi:thioesterase II family protein, partial [Streptacidiphilus cavernicola]
MITLPRPLGARAERWIVGASGPAPASAPTSARLRLFCFPNAGGTAGTYAGWRPHLPPGLSLLPVELPGHGARGHEDLAQDLEELAARALAALSGELDHPYALFGHSFGGLLAFEIARRIEREGLPAPRAVLVSAVRPPHLPKANPAATADDNQLLDWLVASGGLPEELLRHTAYLGRLLRCLRTDLTMAERYQPPGPAPLAAPLHVLGGLEDPVAPLEDLSDWIDWEGEAPFSTSLFPGGHSYLFDHPQPLLNHLATLLLTPPTPPPPTPPPPTPPPPTPPPPTPSLPTP